MRPYFSRSRCPAARAVSMAKLSISYILHRRSSQAYSTKINIDVVCRLVARIIHLLHTPIFSFARDPKREIALADARLTAVDMADRCRDRSFKNKLLCIDRDNFSLDGQ